MRYFAGSGDSLGVVSALPQPNFAALCADVLSEPIRLASTRADFFALPRKEQNTAKRVRYITPAAFDSSPSSRVTEQAVRCNLLALDVDDSAEAARLLKQDWDTAFGDLGFIVWRTISSTPDSPRLRVLVNAEGIPVSRYSAAVRTIAEMIGLTNVTHESKVPVQPMFLPTVFADSTESPVIASNPAGDAFLSIDIIDDGESSFVDGLTALPTDGDQVANLEFLRTPLEGITLPDAASALEHLDPDMPMQAWIEVAAGLKHQFDSEEAYQLWDQWSSKGKKYVDAAETRYRWNTLKAQPTDRNPVTIRSLFKSAQSRGWVNPTLASEQNAATLSWIRSPARSTEQLMDEGIKRIAKVCPVVSQLERKVLMIALKDTLSARSMPLPLPDIRRAVRQLELDAARTTGIPPWAKGLCFVTALNTFYRHTTDRQFAPEVLDLMYSVPQIGEDKPLRPRDYLIQIVGCPQVENLRYDPARGLKRFFTEDSVPYVNTYRPTSAAPEPDRAEEAGELVMTHLAHLIKEKEYQDIILDFMCYMVQFPGRKIRWAPLIQSGEGAGKTALHAMLHAVLGSRNVFKLSGPDLMNGQYNDWASGRQLVTVEEIRVVGTNRHAVMDKLKTPVTDDFIPLHCKYESHRTVPNVTNYLMFTNYMDALAVRDDGRRYFVVSSPIQTPEDIVNMGGEAYFERLYGMIRDNPGGLRAWFEGRTITSGFKPDGRAVATPYLTELADNAASPLNQAVKTAISDEPHPLVRADVLSMSVLRGCLESSHLGEFSDQALASVLRELGWIKYQRAMVNGAKHQLWTKGRLNGDPVGLATARIKNQDLI